MKNWVEKRPIKSKKTTLIPQQSNGSIKQTKILNEAVGLHQNQIPGQRQTIQFQWE